MESKFNVNCSRHNAGIVIMVMLEERYVASMYITYEQIAFEKEAPFFRQEEDVINNAIYDLKQDCLRQKNN